MASVTGLSFRRLRFRKDLRAREKRHEKRIVLSSPTFLTLFTPPDCAATRGTPCSHKAGNVIEMHEHNAISSSLKAFRRRQLYSRHQPANGIIKGLVFR
jgi:hypothetical protein